MICARRARRASGAAREQRRLGRPWRGGHGWCRAAEGMFLQRRVALATRWRSWRPADGRSTPVPARRAVQRPGWGRAGACRGEARARRAAPSLRRAGPGACRGTRGRRSRGPAAAPAPGPGRGSRAASAPSASCCARGPGAPARRAATQTCGRPRGPVSAGRRPLSAELYPVRATAAVCAPCLMRRQVQMCCMRGRCMGVACRSASNAPVPRPGAVGGARGRTTGAQSAAACPSRTTPRSWARPPAPRSRPPPRAPQACRADAGSAAATQANEPVQVCTALQQPARASVHRAAAAGAGLGAAPKHHGENAGTTRGRVAPLHAANRKLVAFPERLRVRGAYVLRGGRLSRRRRRRSMHGTAETRALDAGCAEAPLRGLERSVPTSGRAPLRAGCPKAGTRPKAGTPQERSRARGLPRGTGFRLGCACTSHDLCLPAGQCACPWHMRRCKQRRPLACTLPLQTPLRASRAQRQPPA